MPELLQISKKAIQIKSRKSLPPCLLAGLGLLLNLISADKGSVCPKIRVILSAVPSLATTVLEEIQRRTRTVNPHKTLPRPP